MPGLVTCRKLVEETLALNPQNSETRVVASVAWLAAFLAQNISLGTRDVTVMMSDWSSVMPEVDRHPVVLLVNLTLSCNPTCAGTTDHP